MMSHSMYTFLQPGRGAPSLSSPGGGRLRGRAGEEPGGLARRRDARHSEALLAGSHGVVFDFMYIAHLGYLVGTAQPEGADQEGGLGRATPLG